MTTISSAEKANIIAQAQTLAAQNLPQREIAAKLGIGQSTLSEWLNGSTRVKGHGPPRATEEPASFDVGPDGSIAASSSPTQGAVPSPATVLTEHGIDPETVEIISVRASRWGKTEDPMFQLRVNAIRKDSLLQIAKVDVPELKPFDEFDFSNGSVLFIGDQHLPYMDAGWEEAILAYIRAEEPQLIVCLGDTTDQSIISRHRTHPRFAATINKQNAAAVIHLAKIRAAAPDAEIILLKGNHDVRLENYIQDVAEKVAGIRPGPLPGDSEEIPALDFRRLWQLDTMRIRLIDEDWKLAEYRVAPELSARHGYLTGNNSERKLLETHGRSQVHGHDHRGTITYRTKHDPLDVRVVMSCGCGAEVKPDGLGYQPDPDWTQGAGIGHVWDDGMFVVNFAPYIKNYLLIPGGQRYYGQEA